MSRNGEWRSDQQLTPSLLRLSLIAAGPSTTGESLLDFASLPATALDSYIAHYDLAKSYPPPPSRRSPSPPLAESDVLDENESAVNGSLTSRRGSRVSARNVEDANLATTSSRLRPRSPSSSVAHLFPGNSGLGKRNASAAGLDENGLDINGQRPDDIPAPSHFFDVQEADEYLAQVASKHFAAQPQPKEGEIVVQFLYRCRAGGKSALIR